MDNACDPTLNCIKAWSLEMLMEGLTSELASASKPKLEYAKLKRDGIRELQNTSGSYQHPCKQLERQQLVCLPFYLRSVWVCQWLAKPVVA